MHSRLSGKTWTVAADRSNPSVVPWGKGAFSAYLNARTRSSPPAEWLAHDATHLLAGSKAEKGGLKILVDVGTADQFLKDGQLTPEALERAAESRGGGELELRRQEGYDHSYYFVSLALGSAHSRSRPLLPSMLSGMPSISRRSMIEVKCLWTFVYRPACAAWRGGRGGGTFLAGERGGRGGGSFFSSPAGASRFFSGPPWIASLCCW